MKRTGMKMGLMVMVLVMMFSLFPLASASAGFVPDEQPVQTQSMANSAMASSPAGGIPITHGGQVQTSQASYPYPMSGGYVVYPGRAWSLRLMLPKSACFKIYGQGWVDYQGNSCIP